MNALSRKNATATLPATASALSKLRQKKHHVVSLRVCFENLLVFPTKSCDEVTMSTKLEVQNQVIISLLARSAIGVESIRKIVRGGKKNPRAYVKVYNSLDGVRRVTELARIAGVTQPTMTVVLQSWEAQGIVYDVGLRGKPRYHRLLDLSPQRKPQRRQGED